MAIVQDDTKRPVAHAQVKVWNSSGYSESSTDANGVAMVKMGEPEVLGIEVGGQQIYTNSWGTWFNYPSVGKGITAIITLKQAVR